jgi:ABC-type Fe3+/spermidine/putrescine transport system ATPase subunit
MSISVQGLIKSYGPLRIVHGISFDVGRGEFVSLLGPSGCGKTTTLRCIAGLEDANGGVIGIDGRTVSAPDQDLLVPVHERQVGMVFQSYAIWPHMTVAENIAYPLRMRRVPSARRAELVKKALDLVGLSGFGDKPSPLLSGGQQQRVALARALVFEPALLLLDEPLSNLDAKLREQMRFELRIMQQRVGLTAVYVTHDQEEALTLSDRLVVMNEGEIEQIGTPSEVYERPQTRFVAQFIGKGNMLDLAGDVECDASGARLTLPGLNGLLDVQLPASSIRTESARHTGNGKTAPASLFIRPEKIAIGNGRNAGRAAVEIAGRVLGRAYAGNRAEYLVAISDSASLKVESATDVAVGPGAEVKLCIAPEDIVLYRPASS